MDLDLCWARYCELIQLTRQRFWANVDKCVLNVKTKAAPTSLLEAAEGGGGGRVDPPVISILYSKILRLKSVKLEPPGFLLLLVPHQYQFAFGSLSLNVTNVKMFSLRHVLLFNTLNLMLML